jgi:hypothetical protein
MRLFPLVSLLLAGFTSLSCKSSNYNQSEEKNSPLSQKIINPLAYNAYSIWKGKVKQPITSIEDFPAAYLRKQGEQTSDGSLFVEASEMYTQEKFKNGTGPRELFVPTPEATVMGPGEGDTLVYKDIGHGKFALKFTKLSAQETTHDQALLACAKDRMRLPTAHELFDYCNSGIERGKFTYYNTRCRPSGRPAGEDVEINPNDEEGTTQWTASLVSSNLAVAWWFNGGDGGIINDDDMIYRSESDPSPIERLCKACGNTARFRCVGPAQNTQE